MEKLKLMTVRIPGELHRKLKIRVSKEMVTVQEWIKKVLERELEAE
jgi:predicted HicB family RNase H-like nuclease